MPVAIFRDGERRCLETENGEIGFFYPENRNCDPLFNLSPLLI